jgi:hypothetical protein
MGHAGVDLPLQEGLSGGVGRAVQEVKIGGVDEIVAQKGSIFELLDGRPPMKKPFPGGAEMKGMLGHGWVLEKRRLIAA